MPGFFEHAYVIGNCASNKLLISLHAHNYGEVFIFYSNRSQKSFVIYTTEGNDTFFCRAHYTLKALFANIPSDHVF